MVEFINFYFIPGLVLGCIYAMGAVGISMLFGILKFAHFAHGDLITLGAYFALFFVTVLGLPVLAALPAAMILAAAMSVALDRVFYKPFRQSPTSFCFQP